VADDGHELGDGQDAGQRQRAEEVRPRHGPVGDYFGLRTKKLTSRPATIRRAKGAERDAFGRRAARAPALAGAMRPPNATADRPRGANRLRTTTTSPDNVPPMIAKSATAAAQERAGQTRWR
jgi:hypothetical protein